LNVLAAQSLAYRPGVMPNAALNVRVWCHGGLACRIHHPAHLDPPLTTRQTLSLRENKALVPDLCTTFVVRHSPACAVLLTPARLLTLDTW